MSEIRIVQAAGSKFVSVIDQTTGLSEIIEIQSNEESTEIDTLVDDDTDVSGRYHYTPTGRYHYSP